MYGTLTDAGRVRVLTGRSFPSEPARLDGFERIEPPDDYPYVVRRRGRHVDGILLHELDADALAALDRYEDAGCLYERIDVDVSVDGRRVASQVYVRVSPPGASGRARRPRRTSGGSASR